MKLFISILALFVYLPLTAFSQSDQTLAAANKFQPNINWQKGSAVTGNFSCREKAEPAIFGVSESEIVVAVFLNGLAKKPSLLRYSANVRDSSTVKLAIEDGDFDVMEFKEILGEIPDGLRSSKSCKWLNLSDGKIDSVHIYWNHKTKRFSAWSL
jgi:hypothetical protein